MQYLAVPVQNIKKQLELFLSRNNVVISGIVVFLVCFVLSFVSGSLVIQPQPSKAATGLGLVTNPTMSLSSSGNINLAITPSSAGTLTSGSHQLTASTNVPTGYRLTLATTINSSLPTVTGTPASPTVLSNNTWGYALAKSGAVGVTNGFDTAYATPVPSSTSKWANPKTSATIKNTANSVTGDSTTVYYGAKIDARQASGTYVNIVRYTATANTANIPAPTITSINPDSGTTVGGTQITIVGTGFTVNDKSVTTDVTIAGKTCTDISVSSNTPVTGQDTITCKTPANAAGAANVVITTWRSTVTKTGGYTYVTPATVTFVSPSQASVVAGTESGPVFTIAGTGFTGATRVTIGGTDCGFQVVSDTQIFCRAPKATNTIGSKKIEVRKSDTISTQNITVAYNNTNYPTLQSNGVYDSCTTTATLFRDTRDSQLYYVKRMPDKKCWMVDNLKYANYGTLSQASGKFLTADGTATQSTANSDVAKYVDPNTDSYCISSTNMPTNTNTRCGLLYNWYAATNGTGTYAQSTQGTNVTGSICPANFRLPSGASDSGAATGNGTSATVADFPVLNASMPSGVLMTGDVAGSYYAGWQPAGAWGGTLSGYWRDGFISMNSFGYFWSSTASSSSFAHYLNFYSSGVGAGLNSNSTSNGYAVRCVMDEPLPIDTYPTTGWAGDTVTITGRGFANVTSVTIGNTACSSYQVLSGSKLTCVLPSKTNGSSNNIVVTANGVNMTPQSTYTHMKITYFDPGASTVSIDGTTYNFYANGFTSANCNAMPASNAGIAVTPAASMVYVRDTRNNQTYKVKRMIDNKCWMVDNLKYIGSDMTYNQGDHLGNGGTGARNTINEGDPQNTANIDKRFWNNPMGLPYCYGTADMPARTLTNCGYFYNWYAATNGTGTHVPNHWTIHVTGHICPANFRLLSGPDFQVLSASMNAGRLVGGSGDIPLYHGWQPAGAFGGVFSGGWTAGFDGQANNTGRWWMSTANDNAGARYTSFQRTGVWPGTSWFDKSHGFAVRCAMP